MDEIRMVLGHGSKPCRRTAVRDRMGRDWTPVERPSMTPQLAAKLTIHEEETAEALFAAATGAPAAR